MGSCCSTKKPNVVNNELNQDLIHDFPADSAEESKQDHLHSEEKQDNLLSEEQKGHPQSKSVEDPSESKVENASDTASDTASDIQKLKRAGRFQVITFLVASILLLIATICFSPSFECNKVGYGTFVISVVLFASLGWNSTVSLYKTASWKVIRAEDISLGAIGIANILFIVGFCFCIPEFYDAVLAVQFCFFGITLYCFSSAIDATLYLHMNMKQIKNAILFDKLQIFAGFMPCFLTLVSTFLYSWGSIYFLPSYYESTYWHAIGMELFIWAALGLVLAALIAVFLLYGDGCVHRLRARFGGNVNGLSTESNDNQLEISELVELSNEVEQNPEQLQKQMEHQAVLYFVASLTFLVGSILMYPSIYQLAYAYILFLIGTVMFVAISGQNVVQTYKSLKWGKLTAVQISAAATYVGVFLFLLGMCYFYITAIYCQLAAIELWLAGMTLINLSIGIDMAINIQDNKEIYSNSNFFDKVLLGLNFLIIVLGFVGSIYYQWGIIYWLPMYLDSYEFLTFYDYSIDLFVEGSVLLVLSSSITCVLVFGSKTLERLRDSWMQKEGIISLV